MHFSLLAVVGLGMLTANLPTQTQAQPQPCGGAAFAKVGSTFYIQGGATYADNLIQAFWSLDLSSPWTTSSPAWTPISPPGPFNAFHSAGIASDGSSFITFGRDTAAQTNQIAPNWVNTFNIGGKSWTAANPSTVADLTRRDFQAVTNLAGSKIYILGGNAGSSGSDNSNVLNTYDPATGTMVETTMPANAPQNSSTYAAVWVKRSSNADGTLVAVFSGFVGGAATADPNVYILNTVSWAWTAIPLAGRGRGNAACTVVDDTFIIWGGFYNNPSQPNGTPSGQDNLLLLTLSSGQWKTSYAPSVGPGGAGTSGSTGGTGKSGLSGGAIGGICAGVAVVVAAVAFLFFRKKSKKGSQQSSKLESAHPPAPCTGVAPSNVLGHHHHDGNGGATIATAGHIPSKYSLQPPPPTVYDPSAVYHQGVVQQPPPIGYTGYDQHQQPLQQQQQYPPYLQQAPEQTLHQHRPNTEIYGAPIQTAEDVHYVDENGHLYRRSYQQEVTPAISTPSQPPGATVYYPPPPPPGLDTPEKGNYETAYSGSPSYGGESPYKASVNESGTASVSSYHDSYGVSSGPKGGAGAGAVKRQAGAPQGGPTVEVPVVAGAPQAILQ
ncbi:hypothetical protein EC991_009798 [Linnemannia zychae]|nr:hypothetical protein EC991_009798 [Linnemannia zychae]